eukprot:scaffold675910_cov48-Prasinocladus_malaysianus.AAC.1
MHQENINPKDLALDSDQECQVIKPFYGEIRDNFRMKLPSSNASRAGLWSDGRRHRTSTSTHHTATGLGQRPCHVDGPPVVSRSDGDQTSNIQRCAPEVKLHGRERKSNDSADKGCGYGMAYMLKHNIDFLQQRASKICRLRARNTEAGTSARTRSLSRGWRARRVFLLATSGENVSNDTERILWLHANPLR